jgi:alcohol dehydrogenase
LITEGQMLEERGSYLSGFRFFLSDDPVQQEIHFGPGCSDKVGEVAKELGGCALVVTDPGIKAAGHPSKIINSLEAAGIKTFLYEKSEENPSDSSVQACANEALGLDVNLIIGLGGGSSLDTAKGANFILTNGGVMKDYWGRGKADRPLLPMIAIPTTAGTGSECQSYALISDDYTHRKMACGDSGALPKVTLLDPELTLSQPFSVCAATAMDALAHTLESLVCTKRNKWSHHHASLGFFLLIQNMEDVLQNPDHLDARGALLLGAAHAGAAIERSMLGAAHALANPLTSQKGVIHGEAVSLTLPAVLAYNGNDHQVLKLYAELARCSGIVLEEATDMQAFDCLFAKVLKLREISRLPSQLSRVGCQTVDLEELAREASEQWTAIFNPRKVNQAELLKIYQSIDTMAQTK